MAIGGRHGRSGVRLSDRNLSQEKRLSQSALRLRPRQDSTLADSRPASIARNAADRAIGRLPPLTPEGDRRFAPFRAGGPGPAAHNANRLTVKKGPPAMLTLTSPVDGEPALKRMVSVRISDPLTVASPEEGISVGLFW